MAVVSFSQYFLLARFRYNSDGRKLSQRIVSGGPLFVLLALLAFDIVDVELAMGGRTDPIGCLDGFRYSLDDL